MQEFFLTSFRILGKKNIFVDLFFIRQLNVRGVKRWWWGRRRHRAWSRGRPPAAAASPCWGRSRTTWRKTARTRSPRRRSKTFRRGPEKFWNNCLRSIFYPIHRKSFKCWLCWMVWGSFETRHTYRGLEQTCAAAKRDIKMLDLGRAARHCFV